MKTEMRVGIRFDSTMEWKCLACGGPAEITNGKLSWRTCKICNKSYYRNHCWNCKIIVDSRDNENVKCPRCGWLKCTCTACHLGGCTTNPYKYEVSNDEIAVMEEIMHHLAMETAEAEADRVEMFHQAAIEAAEVDTDRAEMMLQAAIEAEEAEADREEMMFQVAIETADVDRDYR